MRRKYRRHKINKKLRVLNWFKAKKRDDVRLEAEVYFSVKNNQ